MENDPRLIHDIEYFRRLLFWRDRENELSIQLQKTRPKRTSLPSFEDLALPIPHELRLWLDRDDVDEKALDADCLEFRRDGVCIKKKLIPEDLCDRYWKARLQYDNEFSVYSGNYMDLDEMREVLLYPALRKTLDKLLGQPMVLDFVLSGIRSSLRAWHQDYYLLPGYENIEYCAVWVALDDIHPDCGPFEYYPGSHALPSMRRELVWPYITPELRDTPRWPNVAEEFVTPAYHNLVTSPDFPYEKHTYLPKKGDVLIWHHSLLHQGSKPKNPELLRPGLIGHYYSIYALQQRRRERIAIDEQGGMYVIRDDKEWHDQEYKKARMLEDGV